MPIHGVTVGEGATKRWSRAGRLHIGQKTASGAPEKLDYFLLDSHQEKSLEVDFARIYGEKPKSLTVVFFEDDMEFTFPHYLKFRKGKGVWCQGDGKDALRYTAKPDQYDPRKAVGRPAVAASCESCPFPAEGKCKAEGQLRFLLPDMPTLDFFEVRIAAGSIQRIHTSLLLLQNLNNGRLSMATATLRLYPFMAKGFPVFGLALEVRHSLTEVAKNAPRVSTPLLGRGVAPEQSTDCGVGLPQEDDNIARDDGAPPEAPPDDTYPPEPPPEPAEPPPAEPPPEDAGGKTAKKEQRDRNSFFSNGQRSVLTRILGGPHFNNDRGTWYDEAKGVSSTEEAAKFVNRVLLEDGKRNAASSKPKADAPKGGGPTAEQLDEAAFLLESEVAKKIGIREEQRDAWMRLVEESSTPEEARQNLAVIRASIEKSGKGAANA